jgi:glutaredoxin 3
VDFRDVKKSSAALSEMLKHTGGERLVPVIVESGRVTIGYGGT